MGGTKVVPELKKTKFHGLVVHCPHCGWHLHKETEINHEGNPVHFVTCHNNACEEFRKTYEYPEFFYLKAVVTPSQLKAAEVKKADDERKASIEKRRQEYQASQKGIKK